MVYVVASRVEIAEKLIETSGCLIYSESLKSQQQLKAKTQAPRDKKTHFEITQSCLLQSCLFALRIGIMCHYNK
jgi:hypothetical protein